MHKLLPKRLLLLFLAFSNLTLAGEPSWQEITQEESDLAFLNGLASFAISGDSQVYNSILLEVNNLQEMRKTATVSVILDQWIRKDPKGFEKAINDQWRELDQAIHLSYLHLSLQTNPSETTKRLFDTKDPVSKYVNELMYALIQKNPESVADYLSEKGHDEEKEQWADTLMRFWMQNSPEKALIWATEHNEVVDINRIFSTLLYSDEANIKTKLSEVWNMLPDESRTVELQTNVAQRLIYTDPELSLEFIKGLPDEARYPLTHRAMARLAESNSPIAAELMRDLPPEHLPPTGTVKKVLLEWGLRNNRGAERTRRRKTQVSGYRKNHRCVGKKGTEESYRLGK